MNKLMKNIKKQKIQKKIQKKIDKLNEDFALNKISFEDFTEELKKLKIELNKL